jgi:uncharacterized cupredoxin-like copper-binding protein
MFKLKKFKSVVVLATVFVFTFALGLLNIFAQDDVPEEATEFTITMSEHQFAVEGQELGEAIQLEVGKPYTLHFVHAGELEHEVLIGQEAIVIGEGMHHDFTSALLDDVETAIAGLMNDDDFVIEVAGLAEIEMNPGQELSISFTLPEEKIGEWEIGCFVFLDEEATKENPGPSHYDAGMHLSINVVPAAE